jgi:hypothetical protein
MRTPWTRQQLDALLRLRGEGRTSGRIAQSLGLSRDAVTGKLWRLTHRPAQRPAKSAFDAANAAALYRDGWSFVKIATRFDCSKATVAKYLARHGVAARRRGRPAGAGLSALAREIAVDLAGPLGGAASVPALIDWLGETRASLTPALEELSARGFVTEIEGVYVLAQTRHASTQSRDGVQ